MRDARDEWIEKEYPAAIFALKVEHERDSANYEVASYAGKAYEALCNGEPWEKVKAAYEIDEEEFVERKRLIGSFHSWVTIHLLFCSSCAVLECAVYQCFEGMRYGNRDPA